MKPLLALVLLALLPIAAQDDPAQVLSDADRAFFHETRERGLEGWLSWFAEDAVVFPTTGPLVVGSAALRRYYSEQAFPPKGFLWEPEQAGLSQEADLGWSRGRWGLESEQGIAWQGRYLTVWRKDADGKWKVVADCGGEPDFAANVPGLAEAPVTLGRESELGFRSKRGDLGATLGNWWATDSVGGETGGKYLSVWRRLENGTQALVAETGFPQVGR